MTGLLGMRLIAGFRVGIVHSVDGGTGTAAHTHTTRRVHAFHSHVCFILSHHAAVIMCVFIDNARFIHQVGHKVATQCMRSAIHEPR